MMSLVDIVDYDDYIRKVPPFLHRLKHLFSGKSTSEMSKVSVVL